MAHHHHRGIETGGGIFPPHPRGVVDSSGQLLLCAAVSSVRLFSPVRSRRRPHEDCGHTHLRGQTGLPPLLSLSLSLSLRLRRRVVAGRKRVGRRRQTLLYPHPLPLLFLPSGAAAAAAAALLLQHYLRKGNRDIAPYPRGFVAASLSSAVRPMPPACLPPHPTRPFAPPFAVRPLPSRHGASSPPPPPPPPPPRRISPRRKGPPPPPPLCIFREEEEGAAGVSGTGGRKRGSQAVMGGRRRRRKMAVKWDGGGLRSSGFLTLFLSLVAGTPSFTPPTTLFVEAL